MLPIESWRIYYADGSSFSSKDGAWAEAPPFGVQCVVYYHAKGKTLSHGDEDGMVYYHGEEGEYKSLKMGLWMDKEGYYRILDIAKRSYAP